MDCTSASNRVAHPDSLAADAVDPLAPHSGYTAATFVLVVHHISFASTRWLAGSPPVLPFGALKKGALAFGCFRRRFATSLAYAMRYLTMERSLNTSVTGVSRAEKRVLKPTPNAKKTLTFP